MNNVDLEAHCADVARYLLDGSVIPFLGAGVNAAHRPKGAKWEQGSEFLPTGAELAEHLAEEFRYPVARACALATCPDPTRTRRSPDLLHVSQYVAVTQGSGRLYDELHSVFGSDDYRPTKVHHLLARLARHLSEVRDRASATRSPDPPSQLLILTTNYDDALEQELNRHGQEFDLFWYQANPDGGGHRFWHQAPGEAKARRVTRSNKLDPDRFERRPVIVKLHGAIDRRSRAQRRNESFVITEDHYIDYLALRSLLPVGLSRRMKLSSFLFLGYSLSDWNMRVIFHRLWASQRLEYRSWAVQKGPSAIDKELWKKRGVDVLDVQLTRYVQFLTKSLHSSLDD